MPEVDATIEYRDVPGFPGYRVGSNGSVWSCKVKRRNQGSRGAGWAWVDGVSWRKLSPCPDGRRGYLRLGLRRGDGKNKMISVHQIVLLAFVGPRPKGMHSCHFPDKDPSNCNLSNLRYDTVKGNHADKKIHGTQCRGITNGRHKLTNEDVVQIVGRLKNGVRCSVLAREFGVTHAAIMHIKHKRQWKHISEGQ